MLQSLYIIKILQLVIAKFVMAQVEIADSAVCVECQLGNSVMAQVYITQCILTIAERNALKINLGKIVTTEIKHAQASVAAQVDVVEGGIGHAEFTEFRRFVTFIS